MKNPAEVKRQLVCAMGHLRRALENTEDDDLRLAITDSMYQMNRRIKSSSQMDIPIATSETIKRFKAVRDDD